MPSVLKKNVKLPKCDDCKVMGIKCGWGKYRKSQECYELQSKKEKV